MMMIGIVFLLLATGLVCALIALSSLARLQAKSNLRPAPDPSGARAPRLTRLVRPIE
jgi:hypothetical protein